MFKANPSKSMTEHIAKMGKGHKGKKPFFGKKKESPKKGFSLFKKKTTEESDHDYED